MVIDYESRHTFQHRINDELILGKLGKRKLPYSASPK